MPATSWGEIKGQICYICGAAATHFYGFVPICCQCHGGNICSVEEAATKNPKGTWPGIIARDLMHWEKTYLEADRFVGDDGNTWGGECESCGAKLDTPHKETCVHMRSRAIWKKPGLVYDNGDPRNYTTVKTWNPLIYQINATEVLDMLIGKEYKFRALISAPDWSIALMNKDDHILYTSDTYTRLQDAICDVAIQVAKNTLPLN